MKMAPNSRWGCYAFNLVCQHLDGVTTIFLWEHNLRSRYVEFKRGLKMRDRHLNSWDRRVQIL